jgi:formate-dependent nitrite reductase cytochrome c552 subunit
MASWGRNVDVTLTGTGSIDANTNIVTGANTAFTEEVEVRNLINLDDDLFVVISITDDETMIVEPIATATVEDADVLLSEVPKYLTVEQATTEATYVTVAEAQDSDNRDIGIKTPGWTLYKEYETEDGDTRRVVETLVAMKSTS